MKNLVNVKNLKKIGIGILPIMFLLVTLVPGNLLGVNYTADAAEYAAVEVLDPDSETGDLKIISKDAENVDKITVNYKGSQYVTNAAGEAEKANGSVTYQLDEEEKPVVTLKDLDIAVNNSRFMDLGTSIQRPMCDVTIKLEGNNNIKCIKPSSNIGLISSTSPNLIFTGDGNLTLDGGNECAICLAGDTAKNVEFAGSGLIKLTGGAGYNDEALKTTNLKVKSGTVEIDGNAKDIGGNVCEIGGDAELTGGHLIIKNILSDIGLKVEDTLLVGKNAKLSVISEEGAKGIPIVAADSKIVINGCVQAIGSAESEYGIKSSGNIMSGSSTVGAPIIINYGATVEAYGAKNGALEMEGFKIGDGGLWSATVGESKEQAKALLNMDSKTLKEELENGQYKYVKIGPADDASINVDNGTTGSNGTAGNAGSSSTNKKDGVPSTSDTTNIISYVLLLVTGTFIVIASNKKTIFDK